MSDKNKTNTPDPAEEKLTAAPAEEAPAPEEEEFTVLTPEGEDRRPITDRNYMKVRDENYVDFSALAQAEDELHRLREEAGIEEKQPWLVRTINRYYDWKENRQLHLVNKKIYLLLNIFLGWCGMHRFYEKRWLLGLFYLALCWSGLPAMLCVTDILVAIPKKPDENGMIWM